MPGTSSPTTSGHSTHSITAPDFPWHHIGDELVDWLSNLVPCPSCQNVEDYLRSLLRRSIPQLIEVIEEYGSEGKTPAPLCRCASRRTQPTETVPLPLPRATCQLSQDDDWVFNIVTPSTACVQWIKDRLQETYIEQTLKMSWQCYLGFLDIQNRVPVTANTGFTPWAQFPHKEGPLVPQTVNDNTFGPCDFGLHKPGDKRYRSVNVVLKSAHLDDKVSDRALSWLHYLDRSSAWPVDANRGPPLTPSIGTMVRHPDFKDEDALAIWSACTECEVLFNSEPKQSRGTSNHSEETTRLLEGVHGVTVLFLGCVVINDKAALNKLLLMRETGCKILGDLSQHNFVHALRGKFEDSLLPLLHSAMKASPEWDLKNLCDHLYRWFAIWTALYRYDDLPSDSVLALKSLLAHILSLAATDTGCDVSRLFAPSTLEGWEDTADMVAMGTLYGCAVGTITLLSLARIKTRTHNSNTPSTPGKCEAESSTCGSTILCAIFSAILDGTVSVEYVLLKHYGCELPPQSRGDASMLFTFLQQVRESLQSVVKSYQSVLDGDRLLQAVQVAFLCVITKDVLADGTILSQFFGTKQSTIVAGAGRNASLRDGPVRHYNSRFLRQALQDLASLEVFNYSPQDFFTLFGFRDCWGSPDIAPPSIHNRLSDRPLAPAQMSHPFPPVLAAWRPDSGNEALEAPFGLPSTPWITRTASTPDLVMGSNEEFVTDGFYGNADAPPTKLNSAARKTSLVQGQGASSLPRPPRSRTAIPTAVSPHNAENDRQEEDISMTVAETVGNYEPSTHDTAVRDHPVAVKPTTDRLDDESATTRHRTFAASPPISEAPDAKEGRGYSHHCPPRTASRSRFKLALNTSVIFSVAAVLLVGMWMGAPSLFRPAGSTLSNQLPKQMPAARVRQSFTWGGSTSYSKGSIVCIIQSPVEGFYEVLNMKGERDVSPVCGVDYD